MKIRPGKNSGLYRTHYFTVQVMFITVKIAFTSLSAVHLIYDFHIFTVI